MLTNALENKSDIRDTTTYLPQSKPRKNIKILLVEDTPINRKVLLSQLKQIGYKADYVENGQAALERLAEESYDLIFMDCQMPVLDGYEATRLIREREGKNAHTVVVAVTAYAMAENREKCLAAGMDDYLTKPVRIEEIAQVLAKWMPEKSPEKKPKLLGAEVSDISDNLGTNALPQLELSLGQRSPRETGDDLTIEEIIDRDRLQKISFGDKKFIEQLLINFISNTEIYLKEATTALVNNDMETLARRTHQIKGSSATVGVRFMPEIAAKVQNYAQQNELQEIPQLLQQLNELLAQVKHWQSNEF